MWAPLTVRPAVKKVLEQTGGRDVTMIMATRRGRGMNSRVLNTDEISG